MVPSETEICKLILANNSYALGKPGKTMKLEVFREEVGEMGGEAAAAARQTTSEQASNLFVCSGECNRKKQRPYCQTSTLIAL